MSRLIKKVSAVFPALTTGSVHPTGSSLNPLQLGFYAAFLMLVCQLLTQFLAPPLSLENERLG